MINVIKKPGFPDGTYGKNTCYLKNFIEKPVLDYNKFPRMRTGCPRICIGFAEDS